MFTYCCYVSLNDRFFLYYRNFAQHLVGEARKLGMKMPDWPYDVKYVRHESEIAHTFTQILQGAIEQKMICSLIVVVMEDKNAAQYGVFYCNAIVFACFVYGVQCSKFQNF